MNLQEQYPDFFNEEGMYINGSIENKIERIKDTLRELDRESLRWVEGRPSSKFESHAEVINLKGIMEAEINYLQYELETL